MAAIPKIENKRTPTNSSKDRRGFFTTGCGAREAPVATVARGSTGGAEGDGAVRGGGGGRVEPTLCLVGALTPADGRGAEGIGGGGGGGAGWVCAGWGWAAIGMETDGGCGDAIDRGGGGVAAGVGNTGAGFSATGVGRGAWAGAVGVAAACAATADRACFACSSSL